MCLIVCLLSHFDRCNTALKQCISNSSVMTCYNDGDCADGFFCPYSGSSRMCVPTIPLGGACDALSTWSSSWSRCYGNSICFNNTLLAPGFNGQLNGTCTARNSLPTGTVAFAPLATSSSWSYVTEMGMLLCATGLSVPVANASGFPTGQFRCVSAVDISQQGGACDNCQNLDPSACLQ